MKTARETTYVVEMLTFDRSFGAHANELLKEPLRATANDGSGAKFCIELHLMLTTSKLGAFYESPRVLFRIDLLVSGQRVEALEREQRWDSPWVWSQPQAGLRALQSVLRNAQEQVQGVATSLAKLTLRTEQLEVFGQPSVRLVEPIRDDVCDRLWDLFDVPGLPKTGCGSATCTPHIAGRRTLILGPYRSERLPSFLDRVASPWIEFGNGAQAFCDARTAEGDRIVLLGERTDPYALAMLLPNGGTLFQEEPMALPDNCSRVVVWQPDPYAEAAATMFRASTVTRTVWFRGTIDQALDAFVVQSMPTPHPRMRADEFLYRGLVEGWWADPAFQPPAIQELGGRFAFAKLLRSDLPDDRVFAAIDALVGLGASVDGPFEPKQFSDDGAPIEVPLIEAARRGEPAFRHLLQHSRDTDARAAIHATLGDHPSAFVRETTWI